MSSVCNKRLKSRNHSEEDRRHYCLVTFEYCPCPHDGYYSQNVMLAVILLLDGRPLCSIHLVSNFFPLKIIASRWFSAIHFQRCLKMLPPNVVLQYVCYLARLDRACPPGSVFRWHYRCRYSRSVCLISFGKISYLSFRKLSSTFCFQLSSQIELLYWTRWTQQASHTVWPSISSTFAHCFVLYALCDVSFLFRNADN